MIFGSSSGRLGPSTAAHDRGRLSAAGGGAPSGYWQLPAGTAAVRFRPRAMSCASWLLVSAYPVFGTATAAANTMPEIWPLGAISGPPELPGRIKARIGE